MPNTAYHYLDHKAPNHLARRYYRRMHIADIPVGSS